MQNTEGVLLEYKMKKNEMYVRVYGELRFQSQKEVRISSASQIKYTQMQNVNMQSDMSHEMMKPIQFPSSLKNDVRQYAKPVESNGYALFSMKNGDLIQRTWSFVEPSTKYSGPVAVDNDHALMVRTGPDPILLTN